MAEGFKIADAFVQIQAELDQRQVVRAATVAGHHASRGFGDGFGDGTRKQKDGLIGSITGALGGLVDVASRIGTKMGSGLVSSVSSISPALGSGLAAAFSNPYVLAAVAVAAVAIGSFAAAAISGAVLAGLGTGVIAAGVALAIRDPEIKEAAGDLGSTLMDGLTEAASDFVGPVKAAIKLIRTEFRKMLPDISEIFSAASRFVEPLTDAVLGLIRKALPGVRDAVEDLGPVFGALTDALPDIGDAISNLFTVLGEHSEGASKALEFLLKTVEGAIRTLTGAVDILITAWEGWLALTPAGMLVDLALESGNTVKSLHRLGESTVDVTKNTEEQVDETNSLIEVLGRLYGTTYDAIEAEGRYQQAIDDAAESARKGTAVLEYENGVLVQNTEKQRAGASAITDLAKAAQDKAAAVHEATLKTGTHAQAEDAARSSLEKSRAELEKTAKKLGLSAAEAKKLADELLRIPPKVTTTVTTTYYKVDGGYQLAGDEGPKGHSRGGLIRGPGTATSDSIPSMLSDGEYVLKASAVKRIGKGNLDRLNEGMSPAGAVQRPASGAIAGGITINLTVNGMTDDGMPDRLVAKLYDALDRYERRHR